MPRYRALVAFYVDGPGNIGKIAGGRTVASTAGEALLGDIVWTGAVAGHPGLQPIDANGHPINDGIMRQLTITGADSVDHPLGPVKYT